MAAPTRKHYGGIFSSLWISLIRALKTYSNSLNDSSQRQLQKKLCDKIMHAIFHMTTLCTDRDLESKRVQLIFKTEFLFLGKQIHNARHALFVGRETETYEEKDVENAYDNFSQLLISLTPEHISRQQRMEFEELVKPASIYETCDDEIIKGT